MPIRNRLAKLKKLDRLWSTLLRGDLSSTKEGDMRPPGTTDELERRRFRAIELMEEGVPRKWLARILGVSAASLSRWQRLAELGELKSKPSCGRRRRLSDDDCNELESLLRE